MCRCEFKKGYCNYVSAGRGIGMKFTLLFSFLTGLAVAVLFGLVFRMQLNSVGFDSFIDTLPVVKIQDGRIVDPVIDNVVWNIPVAAPDEGDIYVVVNTTVDDVEAIPPQVSIYVTAKKIYTQSDSDIHAYEIPEMENTVITHDVMRKTVSALLVVISAVTGFAAMVLGILSFLFAWVVCLLLGVFFNRRITASGWGRALVLSWAVLWIGSIVCSLSGSVSFPAYPLMWIVLLSAFLTLILSLFMRKCPAFSDKPDNLLKAKNEQPGEGKETGLPFPGFPEVDSTPVKAKSVANAGKTAIYKKKPAVRVKSSKENRARAKKTKTAPEKARKLKS